MYGANVGQLGWLRKPATVNQAICGLVIDDTKADWRFIFYSLLHNRGDLTIQAQGAAQQNLNQDLIRQFAIPLPPLPVQRRIAGILSAYDELLENSQRRIRLLEAMARALYREWFVHLRFPGHEKVPRVSSPLGYIPRAWEVGRLDDVLVLQRGFDLPKPDRVEGTVPIYAATGVTGFHNEAKVKAPGVVTGRSGTIGDVHYVQEEFWPLNTVLWVKEFPKAEPLYAYYVLSSLDLTQFNSGAAVPTLNRNDIHGLDTLIPPRSLQKRFQAIASAMLAQSRTLELQVQTLRRTRDLLLPRLLSGQIEPKAS
jgi:type I restriction enzyme S subunit